ncbi:MAG: HDOD domain-containing protein [Gammaproteobacteria bacterium]|nr:HDOD domain-containing protein [Gammaproteobacteria bacterium]
MIKSPEEIVKGAINLISLPEIYIRLNHVMEDPDHDARQVGDVISYDPALTARILRIVNSVYYKLAVKIELVSRAVSVIGEDDLRNLVLATSVVNSFERLPNELVDIRHFWSHSVHTGIVARLLSRHCNTHHGERLFIAGLLHDIGKLILYFEEPELSEQVLMEASENDGLLFHAENRLFGFNHADVGGALMTSWKMPFALIEAVKYHHEPMGAHFHATETAIVHIANAVVNSIGPDTIVDEHLLDDYPGFEPETLRITSLDLSLLPQIMEQAREQASQVLEIICP